MAEAQGEPKLVLSFLQPFYDAVIPVSWLIVRVAVGWNLLVHGWGKIIAGPTPRFLKAFADLGFTPPELWFWSSLVNETLAGILLILGLFTRFGATFQADLLLCCTMLPPALLLAASSTRRRWLRKRTPTSQRLSMKNSNVDSGTNYN